MPDDIYSMRLFSAVKKQISCGRALEIFFGTEFVIRRPINQLLLKIDIKSENWYYFLKLDFMIAPLLTNIVVKTV